VGVVAVTPDVLRRRLVGLAVDVPDVQAYCAQVCAVLAAAVRADFACVVTTDPAAGMITGAVKSHAGDARDAEMASYEYAVADVNRFCDLAQRRVPVGVLDTDTAGHPERSARYRELLLPVFSFGHELRAGFVSRGAMWGAVGLYRSVGPGRFTDADRDAVAAVTRTVADGIRAVLVAPLAATASDDGPAVLVLDADDRPALLTPAAERRVEDLGGTQHGALPMSLLALSAATRAAGRGERALPGATRIRTAQGGWLSARAAPTSGGVVITLDEARPPEIASLLAAGYGLTRREQDVVRLVLLGADTAAIGARLFLSPWTVQDHLKSIFAKVGVTNRRELTATIFLQQYGPRVGEPLGPAGSFLPGA
jgi:DNA-binding CsgD family transcriptional regulator